jgi:ElaA protein
MKLSIDWRWLAWKELEPNEVYAILQLRQEVFVVEQKCPYPDADGLDDQCWHLLGAHNGILAAYLRVFPPGVLRSEIVIGRVVTSPSIRGRGAGRPLMREGEAAALKAFGHSPIFLSAQAYLQKYYESLGYRICGKGYDEDGIPHFPMRKSE